MVHKHLCIQHSDGSNQFTVAVSSLKLTRIKESFTMSHSNEKFHSLLGQVRAQHESLKDMIHSMKESESFTALMSELFTSNDSFTNNPYLMHQ